jgi:hypothetical protein
MRAMFLTGWISGKADDFQIDARILNLMDRGLGHHRQREAGGDHSAVDGPASRLAKQFVPGSSLPEFDYESAAPLPERV